MSHNRIRKYGHLWERPVTQTPRPAPQHGFVLVPIQQRACVVMSMSMAIQQELYRIAFERAQAEADEREWFELLGDYSI
jgi:hypothetical protein